MINIVNIEVICAVNIVIAVVTYVIMTVITDIIITVIVTDINQLFTRLVLFQIYITHTLNLFFKFIKISIYVILSYPRSFYHSSIIPKQFPHNNIHTSTINYHQYTYNFNH